ncbi:histidine kinase [Burkholderiaceae bacterium DAT-1]|nr:histidine kinase [Burkholderiaceae bacterium DAT-1]
MRNVTNLEHVNVGVGQQSAESALPSEGQSILRHLMRMLAYLPMIVAIVMFLEGFVLGFSTPDQGEHASPALAVTASMVVQLCISASSFILLAALFRMAWDTRIHMSRRTRILFVSVRYVLALLALIFALKVVIPLWPIHAAAKTASLGFCSVLLGTMVAYDLAMLRSRTVRDAWWRRLVRLAILLGWNVTVIMLTVAIAIHTMTGDAASFSHEKFPAAVMWIALWANALWATGIVFATAFWWAYRWREQYRNYWGALLFLALLAATRLFNAWAIHILSYNVGFDARAAENGVSTLESLIYGIAFTWVSVIAVSSSARLRNRDDQLEIARLEADNLREREARTAAEAELKVLQAQIEPHFLFNTLGALRQQAEERAPDAALLAGQLIRFLRGSMDSIRRPLMPLSEEFGIVRDYLGVMKLRMGDRLAFELNLAADVADIEVPPLMLLTLVENAIKHGVEPKVGASVVAVSARIHEDRLVIEVADTGVGLGASSSHQGVGLANIRERLHLRYGGNARLILGANEPEGFIASLDIPVAQLRAG